jgi:hypothetical protein
MKKTPMLEQMFGPAHELPNVKLAGERSIVFSDNSWLVIDDRGFLIKMDPVSPYVVRRSSKTSSPVSSINQVAKK